ncbi:MAG: aminotransferase class V-fold PLP-dependent enzyme [Ideonella sp.]|nr:aminotransferase class V-fold PLP-dependent enzyme [Ideonella sp.]
MPALRANVVLSASQKALMTPPGLGIVAVDAAASAVAARNPGPRFYWDWRPRTSELSYRKFCGTAPQNLMMALEAALELIFLEGEDAVFARHRLLADTVHAAIEGWRTAVRWTSLRAIRPRARCPSPPSRCRRDSTSTRCAAWPATASRWPSPARWARSPARASASATWATRTRR